MVVHSLVSIAYLAIRIQCGSSHKREPFKELQWFIDHKVKQVKFVDRTFNCAPHHHRPLMEFMRDANTETNFHLEMEPELMTEWETNILCETPPGRIQIEVGVQSTHKRP